MKDTLNLISRDKSIKLPIPTVFDYVDLGMIPKSPLYYKSTKMSRKLYND
jgi:hypothetical protein